MLPKVSVRYAAREQLSRMAAEAAEAQSRERQEIAKKEAELAALDRKLNALGTDAERISFFYVVTVNNPSCTVLSNRRRKALYARYRAESLLRKAYLFFLYRMAFGHEMNAERQCDERRQ